eukprot:1156777-Pelagomonas_calceolata.AAC.13
MPSRKKVQTSKEATRCQRSMPAHLRSCACSVQASYTVPHFFLSAPVSWTFAAQLMLYHPCSCRFLFVDSDSAAGGLDSTTMSLAAGSEAKAEGNNSSSSGPPPSAPASTNPQPSPAPPASTTSPSTANGGSKEERGTGASDTDGGQAEGGHVSEGGAAGGSSSGPSSAEVASKAAAAKGEGAGTAGPKGLGLGLRPPSKGGRANVVVPRRGSNGKAASPSMHPDKDGDGAGEAGGEGEKKGGTNTSA